MTCALRAGREPSGGKRGTVTGHDAPQGLRGRSALREMSPDARPDGRCAKYSAWVAVMSRADRGGVSCLSQIVDRDSRDTENRSGDAARRRDAARATGPRPRDGSRRRRSTRHARVRNRPRGRTERDASLRPLPRVAANRVPAVGLAAYPPPPYSSAEGCAPPCADGKEVQGPTTASRTSGIGKMAGIFQRFLPMVCAI